MRYGDVQALDGVSLQVAPGEIFGVVGPNGAGKTTLMECLEGLRRPDSGSIEVLGVDPAVRTAEVRRRTGLQLQTAALPSRLKVGEALRLFSSFYDTPADWRRLLQQLGLPDTATAYVDDLSGGQRQRVFIALALLNDPEIVFVDEITTGLDPKARHLVWDIVRGIREDGATVVMTTHFMEEAERLCDRVAVVDRGRVVALGTVPELVASAGAESTVTMTLGGPVPPGRLEAVPGVTAVAREQNG